MSGGFPRYDESAPRPRQSRAGSDEEIKGWMDSLHDIQKLVRKEDYEAVRAIAMGLHPALGETFGRPSSTAVQDEDDNDDSDNTDYRSKIRV